MVGQVLPVSIILLFARNNLSLSVYLLSVVIEQLVDSNGIPCAIKCGIYNSVSGRNFTI